jgi:predicted lipoprotein with Yx(FWY)xxD motif
MITKRTVLFFLTLACFVAFSAGEAFSKEKASTAVQVKKKEGVGSYLADSKGMTLYYFKKDAPGKSTCTGPCLELWPAFYVEKVKAPAKVKAKDFGKIKREDGKEQTTFKGYPLYYFSKDAKPGDTAGQGVKDVWYVVDPAKFKP